MLLRIRHGPVCASFSMAIAPAIRTREHPMGIPNLSEKMQAKVELGNSFGAFCFALLRRACALNMAVWLENPHTSWMFRIPDFQLLLEACPQLKWLVVDYCRYGMPWRKRTRFVTNTVIGGVKTLCAGCLKHVLLRGRCPHRRMSWTLIAQPYPAGVAFAVAASLALSLRLRKWEGACDPADCAKITNRNIGEAAHPGPVRPTELVT